MSKKLRILSAVAALCFLGSVACFSGYAAEFMKNPSGEDVVAADPVVDPGNVNEDPGPGYVDPDSNYTDPGINYEDPNTSYTDPGTVTPPYVEPDPTYSDPNTTASYDPGYSEPTYSSTTSEVVSDNLYQQNYDNYSYYNTTSYYMDYTSQYNQYITNTYQAQYDDNYYYVPSYTAPEGSLIEVSSKEVDTDELTREDWHNIMLDLSDGSVKERNTQTFNFIKDNNEEGDTSVDWMLYLGIVLILTSVLTVVFVVITTNKANDKQLKVAI